MASHSAPKVSGFPDLDAKLQKPSKKSAFERQKAEAEAKRKREAEETAAVYQDFVKSFDHDDDDDGGYNRSHDAVRDTRPPPNRYDRGPPSMGTAGGKRHFGMPFTPAGLKSGPGSLGPPPSSHGKKRPYDGPGDRGGRDESRGRLAFDDNEPKPIARAFETSDDEDEKAGIKERAEEKAAAKPTLRLANLPPGTSPAVVKALIPSNLIVDGVKLLPPTTGTAGDRKSMAAIVTLSAETAASEMDTAVSTLQHHYLGYGYYLSIHRHLSSAAISGTLPSLSSSSGAAQPFGAKPVAPAAGAQGPLHAGPGRGFAPPSSYGPHGGPIPRGGLFHVPVQPPRDIKKLRMIHKIIEAVLEHGPDFEALLMSRPEVQREEKWAWLWDARSEGGIWYRYRLWEIVTGSKPPRGHAKFVPIFEGSHAWKMPEQPLPYEYQTGIDEFVSDSEYNSSEDEDFDDELNKPPEAGAADQEDLFLSPMDKTKLTHLLARLPTTLGRLRKGDIARITTFAITHASKGSDEVADLITANVLRPFSHTLANPDHEANGKSKAEDSVHVASRDTSPPAAGADNKPAIEPLDTSPAMLIALYVVSDILSSSATSGVRHAWRYRQLFEVTLRDRKVFEGLGLLAEKLQWGRMRAEKWKRSVGLVLHNWEGWCVFPNETQAAFVRSFEHPPALKRDGKAGDEAARKGKWKTVDAAGSAVDAAQTPAPLPVSRDEGSPAASQRSDDEMEGEEEEDGVVYYTYDREAELAALETEDIDGWAIDETGARVPEPDAEGASAGDKEPSENGPREADEAAPRGEQRDEREHSAPATSQPKALGGFQMASSNPRAARKRIRAVDMFADPNSGDEAR